MRGYLRTIRSIPFIGWVVLGLSFIPGLVIGTMVSFQTQAPELQWPVASLATVVIVLGMILIIHVEDIATRRYVASYWAKRGRTVYQGQ
jgi:hypothetical protein